jgi:Spy/CpxP family protein refolding chaperone
MSKFRTAALGAVAVVALASFAGAQVPAKTDSAHRGMRAGHQMDGQHRGRNGGARRMEGRGQGRLMADLKLTDAQKASVKQIHEKYQPQYKALREQGKTQFKALRDARQKNDTSAAARQRFQAQREQFRQRSLAIRQQEQNEIRGVLTADQRARWDAAAKERKANMEARQQKMKERRGARGKA